MWADAALPVQLASFQALALDGNNVTMKWRTISEVNNYGFEVEKSADGSHFSKVANSFVAGHGTTNAPFDYSYTDNAAQPGTWFYRLRQIDLDGSFHFSEAVKVDNLTGVATSNPVSFALLQNYPNPFNPSTTIGFRVPEAGSSWVKLGVYDLLGREVATLVNEQKQAGEYAVPFSANLPSGVYMYRISITGANGSAAFTDVKRMTLLK